MTNDELTALLGSPADIPQQLEEQSTYTDDAGHRLPLPLDESFFEALPPLLTDVLGARRSGVLALMVEPLGGPVGAWNHVLHALQAPFKAMTKENYL